MALFGKGGRRRKTLLTAVLTAGTVGALQALTMVPAGAVLLGGCTYNPATQTVTIQQQNNDVTILSVVDESATPGRASNEIEITFDFVGGPQDCGSATTANTTSVVMLGSGVNNTNEFFAVNNAGTGGSFGSIAFSIDMGNNASPVPPNGDAFAWYGTTGTDNVKVTNNTFEANGGTGTLVGTEYMEFNLNNGGDTLDASGVTATPISVSGDLACTANGLGCALGTNPGPDRITAGGGNDNATAFPGGLTWSGRGGGYYTDGTGTSYDLITGGSSRADGQDVYVGAASFDILDQSTRTATNWLSNNGAAASGEGTCPGAAPGCEADLIATSIDEIVSGSGNDTLVAGAPFTYADGGPGNDTFDVNGQAGFVIDNSYSAPEADITVDLAANKQTGYGDDVIKNQAGDTGVTGGAGDDTFIYPTPSVLTFGSFCGYDGNDTVDASAQTGPRTINLTGPQFDGALNCGTPVPGSGDSTEDVLGGSSDDTITGNTLANHIWGNDGDDIVAGAPNAVILDSGDFLAGGAGNDGYFGGLGADTASFKDCECADGGVTVDVSLGFAEGEGDDSLLDYIEKIEGSKKGDSIKTGPTGLGSSVNTWIKGFGGGDQLVGSDGNDRLAGGGGGDKIRMGAGDDDGIGGGGNDKFWGGGGVDSADGGAGKNTCKGVEIRKNCKKMKNNKAVSIAAKLARLD